MKTLSLTFLRSYAEIFFVSGGMVGLLLCVMTLVNPNVGLAGILAVVSAYTFARFIKMGDDFLQSGFYTYNPLLAGLSLGSVFEISWLSAFFICAVSIMTLLLSVAMSAVFRNYLRLPVLSLPFVFTSGISYLASLRYSNLLVFSSSPLTSLDDWLNLPLWAGGFFRSVGAILFVPLVSVGALFVLLIALRSRILVLLAIVGYYSGVTMRALMYGSFSQAFADPNNFNFVLIAMAIGGVFLVPSWNSYVVALAAVATATVFLDSIEVFWNFYGVPVYALPFNVVSLGFIYALGIVHYPRMAAQIGATPEETLDRDLVTRWRYPGHFRTLSLPFFGEWTVWQAFDDEWTHQGEWRYAYDFVITDEQGDTHGGTGTRVHDYYCFGKPVLSPIRGRVVAVVNDLPDNPIGTTDKDNNWGNLVVLYDERGYYVELSHFASGSIRVQEGEWVERGTTLGQCGNSGYSPQPHIHVQVQVTEKPGSQTLPFSFLSYLEYGRYHANDLPPKDAVIEPAHLDKQLDQITDLILNDRLVYFVFHNGEKIGDMNLVVRMAADGTFYLESDSKARLYFGKSERTFYFYRLEGHDPFLKYFLLALPRLPISFRDDVSWSDHVPVGMATSGLQRAIARFSSSLIPEIARVKARSTFHGRNKIQTLISSRILRVRQTAEVELDAEKGFASIRVGSYELRRVTHEPASQHSAPAGNWL